MDTSSEPKQMEPKDHVHERRSAPLTTPENCCGRNHQLPTTPAVVVWLMLRKTCSPQ